MEEPLTLPYLSSPVTVNWGITARCNFVCSHCFSRLDRSPELSGEEARRVVDILSRHAVMFLNYGTGEPLLREDLFPLTEYAVAKGMKVTMNSNGSLVDGAAAERIRQAGFHSVGISIDSADPRTHDAFRRMTGSFEKAVRAARLLKEKGVPVSISSVVCKVNHRDFPELVSLAKDLGAHTIDLHNFKCSGVGGLNKEKLDLSPPEWKAFYEAAVPLQRAEKNIRIAFDDPILSLLGKEKEEGKLVAGSVCGKLSLYIKPDGEMTPCGFIPVTIGHILKDDLSKVWSESKVLAHLRGKRATGKCSGCATFSSCLGGCTARSYAVYGVYDAPDPHCWAGES
ncbi:MAG: GeoRSP system radical SAM/SPASM protein [Deltaproteobacteria bacterium]|nr:GeoRSP system radical SAM/SPASM protein [Deltaproteobacteria bacterium]